MNNLIVIDPAHGGLIDIGVNRNGLYEKNVVLTFALDLERFLLREYDVKVELTRREDEEVHFKKRTVMANQLKADFFLSIHLNKISHVKNQDLERGYEDIIYKELGEDHCTEKKRIIIHQSIRDYLEGKGVPVKGRKKENFYELRETEMSAMMIRLLSIDVLKDTVLLRNDRFMSGFVEAVGKGLGRALGLKKKEKKPYENWIVEVIGFENEKEVIKCSDELKKKGFETYIRKEGVVKINS